ncbi:type I secretion system permease/ATPase, partial [Klebsiella pneumoniae]|nr:type I secretion system permease/ATPase [Klebsiella pneumoniae]
MGGPLKFEGVDVVSDGTLPTTGAETAAHSHSATCAGIGDPLKALCLVARMHRVAAEAASLRHQIGKAPNDTLSMDDVLLAAKHLGLKAKRVHAQAERLPLTPMPALAVMKDGRLVLLAQADEQRLLMQDPNVEPSRPMVQASAVFASQWTGDLILVASRASLVGELSKFDFSWFIPSIVKHRRLLGEVLMVSFFLQLFALVSPLFFQVVMDKVLVHKGSTTLDVLVVGLVMVV